MECKEILLLLSGHIDGENTADEERLLQQHLKDCSRCRSLLADFEAIDLGVSELSVEPPPGLAQSVMERIRTPVKKRRFLFGGGTLAAALIALAVCLPALSGSEEYASEPEARSAAVPYAAGETAGPGFRSAEARFAAADETLFVVITDNPERPAAEYVPSLAQLPSALVNGNAEYHVDAATARKIVDDCELYTVMLPADLADVADDMPCVVQIAAPEQ